MEKPLPLFYKLGLVGYPLGHSLSPRIHQAGLAACGVAGEYRLHPIPPGSLPLLVDVLESVRSGEILGLNVTIPYKQTIIDYLDDLTEPAGAIGAVNTIYAVDGRLIGDNTDAPGFSSDLHARLPGVERVSRAIVLGAGGSARAVVYALLHERREVTVAARRLSQAENLVDSFLREGAQPPSGAEVDRYPASMPHATGLSQDSLTRYLSLVESHDPPPLLIVNTTPVGMAPESAASPWPAGIPFPSSAMLYDLVYNPAETVLLRTARSQGIPSVNGLGMLVEQAALSFERWTGFPAPRQAMYAAIAGRTEMNSSGAR